MCTRRVEDALDGWGRARGMLSDMKGRAFLERESPVQTSSLQLYRTTPSRRPRGPVLALLAGLAVPIALALLAVTAFELANGGRIYPGVRIAGVDVGHARAADALSRL